MAKKKRLRTEAYHFRIDPNDPTEGEALSILKSYLSDEIGVREVIVAALLALKGKEMPTPDKNRVMARQINATLIQFQELLQEARTFYASNSFAPVTPEAQEQEFSIRRRLADSVSSLIGPTTEFNE